MLWHLTLLSGPLLLWAHAVTAGHVGPRRLAFDSDNHGSLLHRRQDVSNPEVPAVTGTNDDVSACSIPDIPCTCTLQSGGVVF